jgi:PAS domain S-box-containing protein
MKLGSMFESPGAPYGDSPSKPETALLKQWALEQLPLPMSIFDHQGLRLSANEAMCRVLGRPEPQLVGLQPGEYEPGLHMEGLEKIEEFTEQVLATGQAVAFETHTRGPGEERAHAYLVTLCPVKDPAGAVQGMCLVAMDTTEQYRARERLIILNEASLRIGTTLDLGQTVEELAKVGTDHFADFVVVDLLDQVLKDDELKPVRPGDLLAFRRAAVSSVLPGAPEVVVPVGAMHTYHPGSPVGIALTTGRAYRHVVHEGTVLTWAANITKRLDSIRNFGIHSVIVAPLQARGVVLGMAHFMRHQTQERFSEDDRLLAEELARRTAVCAENARRYVRERTTALALQRSLLPGRMPAQGALEIASRYQPAEVEVGIGGDWFDVIPLSGARVALVVGDVVGHGLQASATMGRLRTAVRTLADVDLPPDELLTHLDDLLLSQDPEDSSETPEWHGLTGATCVYAVYDPISRRCTMARAGHPMPLLVAPDGTAEVLDLPAGLPLGVGGMPFESAEFELPEGSTLALFTDGLIEARGRDLDEGYSMLSQVLADPARPLEEMCDQALRTLLTDCSQDDVALLLARTKGLGADRVASWELPAEPSIVARARELACGQLAAWNLTGAASTLELVVSELVTNAIRYGSPPIRLRLIRDTALICEVSDSSGAAPHMRRARVLDEGGRGLLLVAQLTQRWGSRCTQAGKTIWAELPADPTL